MDPADDHRSRDRAECDQGIAGAADGYSWENSSEPCIDGDSGKRGIGACRYLSCLWHDHKKQYWHRRNPDSVRHLPDPGHQAFSSDVHGADHNGTDPADGR